MHGFGWLRARYVHGGPAFKLEYRRDLPCTRSVTRRLALRCGENAIAPLTWLAGRLFFPMTDKYGAVRGCIPIIWLARTVACKLRTKGALVLGSWTIYAFSSSGSYARATARNLQTRERQISAAIVPEEATRTIMDSRQIIPRSPTGNARIFPFNIDEVSHQRLSDHSIL